MGIPLTARKSLTSKARRENSSSEQGKGAARKHEPLAHQTLESPKQPHFSVNTCLEPQRLSHFMHILRGDSCAAVQQQKQLNSERLDQTVGKAKLSVSQVYCIGYKRPHGANRLVFCQLDLSQPPRSVSSRMHRCTPSVVQDKSDL